MDPDTTSRFKLDPVQNPKRIFTTKNFGGLRNFQILKYIKPKNFSLKKKFKNIEIQNKYFKNHCSGFTQRAI